MKRKAGVLAEKLASLTPEQIAEVEDFVELVRLRSQERALTRAAAGVSSAAFEAVWNNPEDDVYDVL